MEKNILSDPCAVYDVRPPRRVISLVPSVTASLFDLGLGGSLVGVTDYCTYPADEVEKLPKIGGPKNPDVTKIMVLAPDLVIANQEENNREAIKILASIGIPVWLTFPVTVQGAINDLWTLANLFRCEPAMHMVDMLEKNYEWARLAGADQPKLRYFCPIWEDCLETGEQWWMTYNDQTYPADVLSIFNGENVFGKRERRYGLLADLGRANAERIGERDTRYPRVSREEIVAAQPELILLPSEPYSYSQNSIAKMQEVFAETPAGRSGRIFTVDGSLLMWPGTRLARVLEELPGVLEM